MKKMKYILASLGLALLTVSCTLDDGPSGGGGGGGSTPVKVIANLFATTNTTNTIVSYDFLTNGNFTRPMSMSSNDNEGIYYDKDKDELVVVSRDQKVLNTYSNVSQVESNGGLNLTLSSQTTFDSPRDLAVVGDFYIVSDNADLDNNPATDEGRFFIFKRDSDGYTLRNTVTVNYAVWGIELIGNDLYSVVDKSAEVAVFKDFISTYTTDVTATPNKRIEIGGIIRLHGITQDKGTVVLTDIGNAENDRDGAFHIINGFVNKFNAVPDGDTLELIGNQVRVSGNLSQMGNPVAVAYDDASKTVFIAERANEGGKILFYDNIGPGGNLKPTIMEPLKGASSLYFKRQ